MDAPDASRFAYAEEVLPYEISASELQRLRKDNPALTVLDVREPWEVATASLTGSKDMPMGEVPSRAHTELHPDGHIVVICHHGMRSLSVTTWLRREGFEDAQSLAGGIDQWSREIDPQVPIY